MTPHLLISYRDNRRHHHRISHRGLGVSSQLTANFLIGQGYRVEILPTDGHGLIESKITATPSLTHVVVMAPWLDPVKAAEWCAKWPQIHFAITCHSNLAFLGADQLAAKLLPQYCALSRSVHNFLMAGNATSFVQFAGTAYRTAVVALPNLYTVNMKVWRPRPLYRGGALDICMPGAIRQLKNYPTGAGAVLLLRHMMGVPIRLHMNTGRLEGGNNVVVKGMIDEDPHVTLVDVPWLEWPEFTRLLGGMNLLLQPSLTESYNIVFADAIGQGVAGAVSPAIKWAPASWKADPDDPADLARVARQLICDEHAPYDGLDALQAQNAAGFLCWKEFLAA
jgi:hypothetical protein